MAFLWRDALWLLILVPALVGIYVLMLRRGRRLILRYPTLAVLRDALHAAHNIRRHAPPAVFLAALILLIVSVARPETQLTLGHEQRTVILAIDVSYSMAATDVIPTRLSAAQAAAKAFVEAQPRDVRIGILGFGGEADVVQMPTRDRQSAIAAIEHLELQYNTAVGSGVIAALRTIFPESDVGGDYEIFGSRRTPTAEHARFGLIRANKSDTGRHAAAGTDTSTAVIVLTDGRTNMGPPPLRAAELAAERGIRVYTVGFGGTPGATIDVAGETYDADIDELVLKGIAKRTHAEYFHASTAQELNNVYRSLSGKVVLETERTEITALLAAIAAMLIVTAAALSLAWSPRLA